MQRCYTKMNEPQTVEELRYQLSQFGIYDYIIFSCMMVACAFIGVYQALCAGKGWESSSEYLFGGRNMNFIPVAMSLISSFITGVALLGTPTEIYLYGTEYMFVFIPIILTGFVASYLLIPVFHELQLSSIYEYLQLRFDRNVRFFGSLLFTLSQICWLPIVIYIPALAFNQVTGVDIQLMASCVCSVCVFYTCLGGLKAVVWTDVVQTCFMVIFLIFVCVKCSLDVGGFKEVWRRNYESGRLVIPTFNPDLTIRHSFWSLTIGGLIRWVHESIMNQSVLQRYLSLPSLSHARRALWIFVFGVSVLILMCSYAGLVLYAAFHDCDPLTTKLAKAKDQLLPLLIMKTYEQWFPGLFMAGIFCSSLSSLSTGLKAMSTVVLEDFIKIFTKRKLGTCLTNFIMRGVVVAFGALSLYLVLIVQKMGTVLQLTISLGSMTGGPVFGVFFCGIFLPWVNAKGALFGGLLGLLGNSFLVIGAQNAVTEKKLMFMPKPTSVEGCPYYYNISISSSVAQDLGARRMVFPLFKISYFWYTAFGGLLTIILALIISALTGFTDLREIDPLCLSPILRNCHPKIKSQLKLKREEEELLKMLKKDIY